MPQTKLSIPFTARGHSGVVRARLRTNDNPAEVGSSDWAQGFPMCKATVDFEGQGYEALFGWVQLVRMGSPNDEGSSIWVNDPLEVYSGLNTPFGFYGLEPVLFDAPARSNRSRALDWYAESFLCFSPSKPMGREVMPVASFSWGFVLDDGEIESTELAPLPLSEWAKHRSLLTSTYPGWAFLSTNDQGLK